ncbi:hypothetical protein MSAN_02004600 [Mycena sanguinolenta]|uniref:F-box protein n=1 Tax=Mycena sanguinolenta TaxID=230812 RepID=A0A8H7CNY0_9AGAR|nr:hypothetical protein MSAN_02004600 [Mycena sanguinolenta]
MPLLKDLVWDKTPTFGLQDLFRDTVNVSRLAISVAGIHRIPSSLMAQITSYKAKYTSRSTLLKDLSAAANLVECDIDFGGDLHGSVVLPRLRRLAAGGTLLGHMVAPAMQELCVTHHIDHVLPFLQRSGCALTRLMLFQCTGSGRNIIRLLRGIPSLTILEIDFISFTTSKALIPALTIPPDSTGSDVEYLCPYLVSLSWGDRDDRMDYPAFVAMADMLRSRWRIPGQKSPSLRLVRIYLNQVRMRTGGKWMQWMQVLADEGMDVAVVQSTRDYPPTDTWRHGWIVI